MSHNHVSPHDEALDALYETKKIAETMPLTFKALKKQKNKKLRILPRSLRRAFRSKNKQHIEQEIAKAMGMGFTKAEIKDDFLKWKQEKEFIE